MSLLYSPGALEFRKEVGQSSEPSDGTQVDAWDTEKDEGRGCQPRRGAPERLSEEVHQQH